MASIALHCDVPDEARDALEGFFLLKTSLGGIQENDDGSLLFFIPEEEWNSELEEELHSRFPMVNLFGTEIIEEKNWNAEWESSIIPVRVTEELVISPSWKLNEAKAIGSKYLLIIDPKMSFGTGHHETTRLCLKAIEEIPMSGLRVLDIGTGSGILALYAIVRGANSVVGIDTDQWSIDNAQENRSLNSIPESQFEIRSGTLDGIEKGEKFDLILANIHRNVLLQIAEQIASHAKKGAFVVLSGILMYDADEIRALYEQSMTFVRELKENEWSALVFRA